MKKSIKCDYSRTCGLEIMDHFRTNENNKRNNKQRNQKAKGEQETQGLVIYDFRVLCLKCSEEPNLKQNKKEQRPHLYVIKPLSVWLRLTRLI